ncbi:MAG: hypothetical protein K2K00_10385 [Muribaculaceae bacterium]|nr:hypothetical protein [Muribaculaceae bacterium]MDE6704064.1 hypothetical protein [Muribaculaceae bacterium]
MISIRTKKNIALTITVLGAFVLIALILQAVLSNDAMSLREWFRIFAAAVVTAGMFSIYRNFCRKS